jgi:hypothetical protein
MAENQGMDALAALGTGGAAESAPVYERKVDAQGRAYATSVRMRSPASGSSRARA